MNHNAVIIFVKFPEKGKVKTRLAEKTGNEFAVSFYRICAEHTFNECLKLIDKNIDTFLFINDVKNRINISNWTNKKFRIFIQKGNDLGKKMYNSFDQIFKMGKEKVVIIGTDLPGISSRIIEEAFYYLNDFDSVIGPASDGGYYLLGLKKLKENLFSEIEWSTSTVFEETIKRIKKNKFSLKSLQGLSDIDTEEDLKLWFKDHPQNKFDPFKNLLVSF